MPEAITETLDPKPNPGRRVEWLGVFDTQARTSLVRVSTRTLAHAGTASRGFSSLGLKV